ncbi:hypothetical protein LUZ60_011651 [Juncus effusus]|nr:hypothetical protein LUZ60_011651 [Juncus effusus]
MEESSTAAAEAEAHSPAPAETEVEMFSSRFDELVSHTDELEKRVHEVIQFYETHKRQTSNNKPTIFPNKEKASNSTNGANINSTDNNNKSLTDGAHTDSVSKKMQDLMRQFGSILRQITTHKWAWPFMKPVDVKALSLHDYYDIVKNPMDIGTIQNRMEGKEETYKYKNVREIYSDLRLVFKNAMSYNEPTHDVHVMAKTLIEKVEEKWLQLLPKVIEEETRQQEEEAQVAANVIVAQEASIARLARDTDNELSELNLQLEELRETVMQRCGKMSTEEKRKLGTGLSNLSAEDLNKALEIIAQDNPNFRYTSEEVDLDMDAQSEITLWRLKLFVREALEQAKNNSATKADDNSKRKREICDALAKTAKKRIKKLSP